MQRQHMEPLYVENISVPEHRLRALNPTAVDALKDSLANMGLRTPITVRWQGDDIVLVAGLHRLKAAEALGWEKIDCLVMEGSEIDCRLWEIAENLHRCDLSAVERADHINEWRRLVNQRSLQDERPSGGKQPKEAGISKTARELGINIRTVSEAAKIGTLPQDVRDQAREERWPATKLLNHGKPPKPAPLAPDPRNDLEAVEAQVARLMSAWNAAGPEAREAFRERAGL